MPWARFYLPRRVNIAPRRFKLLLVSIIADDLKRFFLGLKTIRLKRIANSGTLDRVLQVTAAPTLMTNLATCNVNTVSCVLLLAHIGLDITTPSTSLVCLTSILVNCFFFRRTLSLKQLIKLNLVIIKIILIASH